MVGDPPVLLLPGCLNEFARLVTLGEEQEPLVTRSVRLAKAKVAGSNPVFRSKYARISSGYRVPGFSFRLATQGDAAG
jgi:hypothetical protein